MTGGFYVQSVCYVGSVSIPWHHYSLVGFIVYQFLVKSSRSFIIIMGLDADMLSIRPEAILYTTHYSDVIISAMASQITSLPTVYSTVYSDADQSKHQSSASLAFVWGIHRGPVNSAHKWPVTRKMFPLDDVIMFWSSRVGALSSSWV